MSEQATKTRTAFTKDDRGILNNWAIEPKMYVEQSDSGFGFTKYAELMNGRFAMIGFVALVATEMAAGKGFLQILGF
jgi:hypothetical protein